MSGPAEVPAPLRVLIADDNDLLRAGLVAVLSSDPGIRVCGEAADGPGAVRLAVRTQPQVVLMDIEMPGGDGITATRELVRNLPDTRVLVLTMFDLDDYIVEARRASC